MRNHQKYLGRGMPVAETEEEHSGCWLLGWVQIVWGRGPGQRQVGELFQDPSPTFPAIPQALSLSRIQRTSPFRWAMGALVSQPLLVLFFLLEGPLHDPILYNLCLVLWWLFSHQIMSDSLWPHGLQHARPPCPSLSSGVCPSSCPLNRWCHPTISSFVALFSFCLQSFALLFCPTWISVLSGLLPRLKTEPLLCSDSICFTRCQRSGPRELGLPMYLSLSSTCLEASRGWGLCFMHPLHTWLQWVPH